MKHEKQKILAAFDLETSGLDPAVHDIIEIAIVPLNPDFKRSDLPHSPDKSRPSRECRS